MTNSVHLSEEEVALAASGGAPPGPHLEACDVCRARVEELRRVFCDFTETRRTALDHQLPPIGAARAGLEQRLAGAYARPEGLFARLSSGSGPRLAAALACIVAALTVVIPARRGAPTQHVDARFVPDPALTPGLAVEVSRATLCSQRADTDAAVSRATAREVFRLHGIVDPRPRAYEIDHLIPPELGGVTDVRNLWPQPYDADPWNAHAKDALEGKLLELVCNGELEPATAQRALAEDWPAAYRRYFRVDAPLVEHAGFLKDQPWE